MQSAAKKPRTQIAAVVSLHRSSYVSQRALEAVLRHVHDRGLPSAFSRRVQARASEAACIVETPFGKLCSEITLKASPWEVQVMVQWPMPMLWLAATRVAAFADLLRDMHHRRPSSLTCPWRLVVYMDGITPTDPLAKGKDKRTRHAKQ